MDTLGMFKERVLYMEQQGFIINPLWAGDNVCVAMPSSNGWKSLASQFIVTLPGQSAVISEKNGMRYQYGNKNIGFILPPKQYIELSKAQKIALHFNPAACECFSMGGLARKCLEYITPPPKGKQPDSTPDTEALLSGIQYGYMECVPGVYPMARKFDVSGYYYNIVCKMPHLRPCMMGTRLVWPNVPKTETERLAEVLEAVKPHKLLRNSIAGTMAGSPKWRVQYASNGTGGFKLVNIPPFNGYLRTGGLLIIRAGWELTRAEVDAPGTVYARTDSIITTSSGTGAWSKAGFNVKDEGYGPTDILAVGAWKVGDNMSIPYAEHLENLLIPVSQRWEGEVQEPSPVPRLPMPEHTYLNWL